MKKKLLNEKRDKCCYLWSIMMKLLLHSHSTTNDDDVSTIKNIKKKLNTKFFLLFTTQTQTQTHIEWFYDAYEKVRFNLFSSSLCVRLFSWLHLDLAIFYSWMFICNNKSISTAAREVEDTRQEGRKETKEQLRWKIVFSFFSLRPSSRN